MKNIFITLSILTVISGCSSSIIKDRNLVDSNYITKIKDEDSPPLLIAADLQIHFIYNSINTRINIFDDISESIRPSAADLFAPDHFDMKIKEFQDSFPEGKTIILGDVLDVSCDWEAEKFFGIMEDKANWVLAPGNHDFIFLGTHEKEERTKDWTKACEEAGKGDGKFNKVEFIFSYLEALAGQAKITGSDPSYSTFSSCLSDIRKDRRAVHECLNEMKLQNVLDSGRTDRDCPAYEGLGDQWVNCKVASNIPESLKDIPNQGWWKNKDPEGYLQDVFWYINPADEGNGSARESYYAYSYILQKVRLPDGRYAILLDTNNPAQLRSVLSYPVGYNPANSANMLYSQMNAASILMGGSKVFVKMNEAVKDIQKAGEEYVLMSHHPINNYKFEAKKGLCLLVNVGNVSSIYTAHTHKPSNKIHKNLHWRLDDCEDIVEYNIGSMIDAPLEYMLVTKNDNDKVLSSTVDLSDQYQDMCKDVEEKWKRRTTDEDYYTSYDDLGWFASEKDVHSNLMNAVITHFIEMLDEGEGFRTVSGNWPAGTFMDDDIKGELIQMKAIIQEGGSTSQYRDRLMEFGAFFSGREVENMKHMKKYKSCQLHWASSAKKKL